MLFLSLVLVVLLALSGCGGGQNLGSESTASRYVGTWTWHNSHGQGRITITQRADGLLAVRDTGSNDAQFWNQSFVLAPVQATGDTTYRESEGDFEARLLSNGHLLVTVPDRECSKVSASPSPSAV